MSFTHYTIPSLDLFNINPLNLTIESSEWVEVSAINPINQSDFVEFRCLSQPMTFKSLSEIYLKAELQILKSDDKEYSDSDKIQPSLVNNALFSLIKSASLYINNVQVLNLNETFASRDIIESLINFDKATCKSRLVSQGLFPIESADERQKFFANSKVVELKGKFNILNCDKFLIPGCDLLIKLLKHDEKFLLIEGSDEDNVFTKSKLVLKDLKIEIRHIKTRENFNFSLESQLAKGAEIEYDFKSGEVTSYSLPSSTTNYVAPAVLLSLRPSFILATFIESSNFLGDREKDSHLFAMSDMTEFSFIINGALAERVPLNFKNTKNERKYADVFINLFRSLDRNSDNCNSLVNYENFPTNAFFLTHDCTSYNFGLSNVVEPNINANIGFSCIFSKPLKNPITVLIYTLKNRKFKINGARKVETIY